MGKKKSFAVNGPRPPLHRPGMFAANRSVPALVIEGQSIPKIPIDSWLGASLAVSGTLMMGEALLSLFLSSDQSTLQTIFRLGRIVTGGGLIIWVAASST